MGESGGLMIYGFVGNSPAGTYDPSGLSFWCCEDKCAEGAKECDVDFVVGNGMALVDDPYGPFKRALQVKNYAEKIASGLATVGTKPVAEACVAIANNWVVGELEGLPDAGELADALYRNARTWSENNHPDHAWVRIKRRECHEEHCWLYLFGSHLDWSDWVTVTQGSNSGYTSGDMADTGWVPIVELPFGIHDAYTAQKVEKALNSIVRKYCE
jgi:hypothetical protein